MQSVKAPLFSLSAFYCCVISRISFPPTLITFLYLDQPLPGIVLCSGVNIFVTLIFCYTCPIHFCHTRCHVYFLSQCILFFFAYSFLVYVIRGAQSLFVTHFLPCWPYSLYRCSLVFAILAVTVLSVLNLYLLLSLKQELDQFLY